MNVNKLSLANVASRQVKVMKNIPLKYGKTADLTVGPNNVETLIYNRKGKICGGKGIDRPQGITSKNLWSAFENIQSDVQEGFDFFKEFVETVLR